MAPWIWFTHQCAHPRGNAVSSSAHTGVDYAENRWARSRANPVCASLCARSPHHAHAGTFLPVQPRCTQVCTPVRIRVGTGVHRSSPHRVQTRFGARVHSSAHPRVRQRAHESAQLVYTWCAPPARLVSAKSFRKEGVRRALPKRKMEKCGLRSESSGSMQSVRPMRMRF